MPNGSTRLTSSRTEGRGRESLGPVRYPCPVIPLHGSANDGVAKGSPPWFTPSGSKAMFAPSPFKLKTLCLSVY